MEVKFRVDLKFFLIITFLIIFLSSCGTNYYYNEFRSLRPKRNVFDNKVLELVDYKLIDTNAIYISSDKNNGKWFYKFYSKNKVGYGHFIDSLTIDKNVNPKKLKMGYFEIKNQKLHTYIFINKGNKTFNRSKSLLYKDSIIEYYTKYDYKLHTKEKLLNYNHKPQPDW